MTASAQPRSKKCRAPPLPKPVADSSSFDHEPSTVAVASDPVLLRRAGWGKEAATPGESSSRLRTFSGFPPAIHPRESPAAADSAAIIRQLRKLHVSLDPLSARNVAPRNTKTSPPCEEAVEDETSLWMNEENREVLQFCQQLPMRSQSLPRGQTIPCRSAMNRSCDYQALKYRCASRSPTNAAIVQK
jgi:hypothetical protein